jgi:hypothetical protein
MIEEGFHSRTGVGPRHAGTEWTFKLTITPIIPKLF